MSERLPLKKEAEIKEAGEYLAVIMWKWNKTDISERIEFVNWCFLDWLNK